MWIQTHSGQAIDVDGTLDPEAMNLGDIAHGLAMTTRYGGQCKFFYSVAEHSINVWRYAREYAKAQGMKDHVSLSLQRAALMHDAQEAYLGDIPKPLKMALPGYQEIEKQFEAALAARFGLATAAWKTEIKEADIAVLFAERAQLLGPSPRDDWSHGIIGEAWPGCEVLGWPWQLAKERFLYVAEGLEIGH